MGIQIREILDYSGAKRLALEWTATLMVSVSTRFFDDACSFMHRQREAREQRDPQSPTEVLR